MTEECTVIKTENKTAFVSLVSREKCGGCKACAFGRSNKLSVPAIMEVDCKAGDRVKVKIPEKDVPAAALTIYLIPLVFLAVGFVIGGLISDILRIVFALIFTALSMLPCVLIEQKFRKRQEYQMVVTEVIEVVEEITADNPAENAENIENLSAENLADTQEKNQL